MHSLTLAMPGMLSTVAPDEEAQAELAEVESARNGDRDAFGLLVERHQQRVFRLASRFFRHPEDVEEAAQDTFLTAWRKLATYRASAPFEHWLTRVCLNTCYMRLRKVKPTEQLSATLPAPPSSPEARLDAERLLAQLPAQDRFLLLMLHGEGWSTQEIAERTGWSRANVKVRAFRARRKLRQLVEEG
jgi:RNA polymerase sigma-70 factor (ECF subfamily)